MQLLHRLNEKEIKMIAVDRNVTEALRLVARKLMVKALR
jgi:ABC-type lipopolysaccharide export system ATPase subunit